MQRRFIVVALATILGAGITYAQEGPLSLSEAEQMAVAEEPQILSLDYEADAFDELAIASTKLPDVQIRSGLMNFPLERGGFKTEGMTHLAVGLRQTIPPRGQRFALSEKNTYLARQKREEVNARTRDVTLEVRNAWLEANFSDRAVDLVTESRTLFVELVQIARSLYSVGTQNQNDVLQADLELLKLDDRLLQVKQDRAEAYASLSQLLGQPITISVQKQLPTWGEIPSIEQLQTRLPSHPLVVAKNALLQANDAHYDYEESGLKPSWTFDVAYSYRDGQLPTGSSRSDFVSATLSLSAPLWRNERQKRRMSAETLRKSSTSQDRSLLLRNLNYQLDIAHSRWETLSNRLKLYEESMNQQSEDHAQATLASYRNKVIGLSDVARSYIGQIDTQLAYQRIQIDLLKTWAKIDSLVDLEQ